MVSFAYHNQKNLDGWPLRSRSRRSLEEGFAVKVALSPGATTFGASILGR
jgi:hypothetical protein